MHRYQSVPLPSFPLFLVFSLFFINPSGFPLRCSPLPLYPVSLSIFLSHSFSVSLPSLSIRLRFQSTFGTRSVTSIDVLPAVVECIFFDEFSAGGGGNPPPTDRPRRMERGQGWSPGAVNAARKKRRASNSGLHGLRRLQGRGRRAGADRQARGRRGLKSVG